ncbi:hypothetical protein [Mangrovimonas sp. TPBH4]|uniref:hypothetical protein n=1 Tax=Mangrovimonas sp. TPBH4 TaxID=1645914 RepID=UPI0006B57CF9|nr:hypothetical protein [Mangrovimonas sp. TPBH4]
MKKLFALLMFTSLLFTACEGDQGPPGPPGQDGVYFVGQSFERTMDLTSANNYQTTVEIPLSIDLYESDMVLVYRLIGQVDGYDVWKLLPETIYTSSGEFQYNFEHNFDYVTIFMDFSATFNFNELLPSDTLDQIFRIVILPVDFVNSSNIDVTNYDEVMEFVQ